MPPTEIAFLGDIMLGRGVEEVRRAGRPAEAFWGGTLALLRAAAGAIANLECALTTHARPWSRTPKVFHFRAAPAATAILAAAGIRWVSLANNHSLDFEEEGLLDTIAALDRAGIAHGGAGRDRAAAMAPALVAIGDLLVGLIALTDNEPAFAATDTKPGTWYAPIAVTPAVLDPIAARIDDLRRAGAALVVVSLHWGPNMVVEPPPHHRAFARALIERGADVVHGHSAHLVQGVEVWRGRPILYDTGDVLDDYAVDPVWRNDHGMLFRLVADAAGPIVLAMEPLVLSFARVDPATGATRAAIRDRFVRLCAALGTALEAPAAGPFVLGLR